MNSLSKIKNIPILILSIIFFSCENHVEEELKINGGELCDPDISFSSEIKSIIDTNCISCHGGNQAPDLRTFDGISNNAERVKTQVINRIMPLGGSLSNDEIEKIRCWIESGALNN